MNKSFFQELSSENVTGVAYKNVSLKKQLVYYFATSGNATIPELCQELKLSPPKMSSILTELMEDGLVQEQGKLDSTGGRRPQLYGLVPDSGFFMGVEVKQSYVNIGVTDLQKNMIALREKVPYTLRNNQESLQALLAIINEFLAEMPIQKEKMLGLGINLSGRVNPTTGYSYSFFNFHEDPLSKIIEAAVGIKVFLENDSQAMAYGEFVAGAVKDEKDVLFLNLDYGIGMGILIGGQLYHGKSGYSGEFGHAPIFENELICQCGKKGCLETEASGWALVEQFKQRIREGSTSLIMQHLPNPDQVFLDDIIEAANKDDVLSIELIAEIGEKLGRGIAMLINIFNPEMVVLGGRLSESKEYISLPIRAAVNKFSLSIVNNDTQFRFSKLGHQAGVIGACLLVRHRLLSFG